MNEATRRPARKTLVFAATRNHEHRVDRLCREALATRPECDVLIVDDGSTDGTRERLDAGFHKSSRLRVVSRPRALGIGSAHLLAMLHAVQQGYEFLVTLASADDTACIAALISGLQQGQCCQLDSASNDSSLGSGLAGLLAGPLAGLRVGQTVYGTRAYRVSLLEGLDFSELPSEELPFLVEISQRIRALGARMQPVSTPAAGTRSRHRASEGVRALWRAITGTFSGRARKRPDPDPIDSRCYSCNSRFLVEKYRSSGAVSRDVRAYQCTSMDHRSKPQVIACLQCGLQYVQESEMPPDLEEMYSDVVDHSYLENIAARRKTFTEVYARIKPALPEQPMDRSPRMLELGCYCGAFMEVARDNGWQTRGIEPSRWASSYASERGLDVHCGTLDDFPDAGEKFDCIVMWDVLEHVKDPIELLRQASQHLEDDGVIFLSTLDVDNWFPRLTGKSWPWLMSMHIFYYSAAGLTDLYRKAGLRMDEIQPYCHYISVRYLVEKICTLMPSFLRPLVSWLEPITPRSLFIPFHFGDIKLYTGSKLPTAVPATARSHASAVAVEEFTL